MKRIRMYTISIYAGTLTCRDLGVCSRSRVFKAKYRVVVLALLFVVGLVGPALAEEGLSRGVVAQAHKLRMMSRAYTACGAYSRAKQLAEKALEVAEEQKASDPELCACRLDLAYLYAEVGEYDKAEVQCREGLELQGKFYSRTHPDVASALKIMSGILLEQGKFDDARITLERAIAIMLEHHAEGARAMASYEIARARLLCKEGRLDSAESSYLKTLKLLDASLGAEHAYTAGIRVEIATLYIGQERYDEAELLVRDAIRVQQKVYGEDHHFLIPAWLVLAHVHRHRGEQEEAREMIDKSLLVASRNLEPAHPLARKLALEARALGIVAKK